MRGQFPAVCNTEDSLASKTCCPNNCGGARGDCVDVSDAVTQSWNRADPNIVEFLRNGPPGYGWPMDVRYQWPLRVFQNVCQCEEGWGGYDCSDCDFGYIEEGGECVKRSESQLYERKQFSNLSKIQQDEYFRVLQEAKKEDEMVWAVVTEEPMHMNNKDGEPTYKLQNVSTYDMLVVLHFLSAREKDNDDCKNIIKNATHGSEIDFAHEFSGFITWHRYYLLITERELRRVAKRLGISHFALSYWAWNGRDENIFNAKHFGKPTPGSITKGKPVNVTGSLFENGNWPVVCNENYKAFLHDSGNCTKVREVCNIQRNRAQNIRLQRGMLEHDVRLKDTRFLPGNTSIQMALAVNNNNEHDGFRKRLEGYVDLCASNKINCTNVTKSSHDNMHNAVHIYVGGHMRVLGPASNDPVFFLHHANIDRILESWLTHQLELNGSLPPFFDPDQDTVKHPGCRKDDYMTPLFPLKTNDDMYKTADQLGYKYDAELPADGVTYASCSQLDDHKCSKDGYHPDDSNTKMILEILLPLLALALVLVPLVLVLVPRVVVAVVACIKWLALKIERKIIMQYHNISNNYVN